MKLDPIFTSHMVFAAGLPIRIYGKGKGIATVRFAGNEKSTASDNGEWLLELPSMPCGGPYSLEAELDGDIVILDDIYIGKVFLCAGQSNMQFKLQSAKCPKELLMPNIKLRVFTTRRMESERFSSDDGWVVADSDAIPDFSALGYFIGNDISQNEDVAVGIIGCYQGASMIESWVPEQVYQKAGIAVDDDKKHGDYSNPLFERWNRDGCLYNFQFSQVKPFSVSAVVWYQGESNTSFEGGKVYAQMLKILIDVWREDLRNSELPFVVVQIADFVHRLADDWRMVQKAQLDVQEMTANVKTVISSDVSETDDIHPPTKHILAQRIVAALNELKG